MADDTERLVVMLEARIRDFEKSMARAERVGTQTHKKLTASSATMTQNMQRSFASAAASFNKLVVGFVSVAAVRSIGRLGKAAIDAADEIGEASAKLGIGAEHLQRFRFAAEQADVGVEKLDGALTLFSKNLATGKIAAEGQNIADSFQSFIARIAAAPTQIEKVRIAQEGLGRQFQTGILLAAQGAEEFRKQYDSAYVYSARALEIASQLDNQFRAIKQAASVGFGTGFIESFGGALDDTDGKLDELHNSMAAFGGAAGTAFRLATVSVTALGNEMAENQKQTAAYVDAIAQWRAGTMSMGEAASVLMDPREHMRRMSAIQQSTDWWRNAAAGANDAATATGGAADALTDYTGNAELAKMASESFWKATVVPAELNPGLKTLADTMQRFGDTAADAFASAIVGGEDLADVVNDLLKSLAQMALSAALKMIFAQAFGLPGGGMGGLSSMLPSLINIQVGAKGMAVDRGRLLPFASGGIVDRPTLFPMASGMGLMGEAGPEAIMPLRRGPDGRLGVSGDGVVNNITIVNKAPDTTATKRETPNDSGGVDVEVIVDQIVSKKMGQLGSGTSRSLSAMGVRPPVTRR